MWRKLGLIYLLALSNYLYAGDIELTMRAEKESKVNINGETLTVRQPVKRINVGDELTVVLNYTNNSDDDTFNIHIDNPIPAGTRFVLGSGFGKNTVFLVSYDGGMTYVDDIHINKMPVTHVRWLFDTVPARAKGEIGFKLQIEQANHGLLR
jgi:uncharacterized repeat protein (TIGR01451 family)